MHTYLFLILLQIMFLFLFLFLFFFLCRTSLGLLRLWFFSIYFSLYLENKQNKQKKTLCICLFIYLCWLEGGALTVWVAEQEMQGVERYHSHLPVVNYYPLTHQLVLWLCKRKIMSHSSFPDMPTESQMWYSFLLGCLYEKNSSSYCLRKS